MNKLTLLSLSLLMISACNAMDEDSAKDESPKQAPDSRLTRFILGDLKRANAEDWCRRYGYVQECGVLTKQYVLDHDSQFSRPRQEEKIRVTSREKYVYSYFSKPRMKTYLFLSRNNENEKVLESFTTYFEIKGSKAIKNFEQKLKFNEPNASDYYSPIELLWEINKCKIASDSYTECHALEEYEDTDGILTGMYRCYTKNFPLEEFAKELNGLDAEGN